MLYLQSLTSNDPQSVLIYCIISQKPNPTLFQGYINIIKLVSHFRFSFTFQKVYLFCWKATFPKNQPYPSTHTTSQPTSPPTNPQKNLQTNLQTSLLTCLRVFQCACPIQKKTPRPANLISTKIRYFY